MRANKRKLFIIKRHPLNLLNMKAKDDREQEWWIFPIQLNLMFDVWSLPIYHYHYHYQEIMTNKETRLIISTWKWRCTLFCDIKCICYCCLHRHFNLYSSPSFPLCCTFVVMFMIGLVCGPPRTASSIHQEPRSIGTPSISSFQPLCLVQKPTTWPTNNVWVWHIDTYWLIVSAMNNLYVNFPRAELWFTVFVKISSKTQQ